MVYSGDNNNKFYKASIRQSGIVYIVDTNWGRVGASGQSKSYDFDELQEAEYFYEKKVGEKEKKGYKQIEILDENTPTQTATNPQLENLALKQINFKKGSKNIEEFILRLVDNNIHQITEGYNITVNKSTGAIETPLGIISGNTINEGKAVLDDIESYIKGKRHQEQVILQLNENYYSRIPKVYRHIEDVLIDNNEKTEEAKQYCKQLEQTLDFYSIAPKKVPTIDEQIFDLKIDTLNKDREFNSISRYFKKSRNRHHGHLNNYDITNIYKIDVKTVSDNYKQCDIKNVRQLWHGTKVSNMLSILKSGLVLPENLASIETTGAMFGYGLYFADQSTKSLQYCAGTAPGQHSRYSGSRLFMFLANVRMGKEYIPRSSGWNLHKTILNSKRYDSTFAQADKSSVMNNEFIVYRTNQVNLTHIVELKE